MAVWPGRFERKHPLIDLMVAGTQGNPEPLQAVVDTGFDGFLMMSARRAEQHGFQPGPSVRGTLADGRRVALATALANVGFARRSHAGVVTLAASDISSLVGIDFLRAFNLALVMTSKQVWLMDEPEFERVAINSGARKA